MRRLFWFGAGVAAGVALTRKAGETARKATPVGMADQLSGAMRELAGAVGSFGAEVRAGMTEREHELHETVAEQSGIDAGRSQRRIEVEPAPAPRPATQRPAAGTAASAGARPSARRARRAGR